MPYDLNRFIAAQERDYETALKEITEGFKRSHWMRYIFPQISGLGHSPMAKKYEIVDLGEAKAYMENPYLRDNLKLCSCMTLFELAAPEVDEFKEVLERFFGGKRDDRTIAIKAIIIYTIGLRPRGATYFHNTYVCPPISSGVNPVCVLL